MKKKREKEQAIVIHRSSIGAIERVISYLIEKYAGAFPVWLAPVQVKVLPITDKNVKYAQGVVAKLQDARLRVELDDRNETLQAKIRDSQLEKVPYMLIVGDKEASGPEGLRPGGKKVMMVSVRSREEKDLGQMGLEKFVEMVKDKIDKKSLDL